jgi:hypothetical protein
VEGKKRSPGASSEGAISETIRGRYCRDDDDDDDEE